MKRDLEVHVHARRFEEAVDIRIVDGLDPYDVRPWRQPRDPECAVSPGEVSDERSRLWIEGNHVRAVDGDAVQPYSPRDDAGVRPEVAIRIKIRGAGNIVRLENTIGDYAAAERDWKHHRSAAEHTAPAIQGSRLGLPYG